MFTDIGGKIKSLAVGTFVLEAIGFVMYGLAIFEDAKFLGTMLIIVGPIIAWISSWLLYGFGELIEKTSENEGHNREMLKIMQKFDFEKIAKEQKTTNCVASQAAKSAARPAPTKANNADKPAVSAEILDGEKVCPACGTSQRADRSVCWFCGQKFEN